MSISILEEWSELSFAKVLIKGRVAVSRWLRWEEIVLRHRTPSSLTYLFEVTEQALRLIVRIPLIQRREKCPSREEKSAFP